MAVLGIWAKSIGGQNQNPNNLLYLRNQQTAFARWPRCACLQILRSYEGNEFSPDAEFTLKSYFCLLLVMLISAPIEGKETKGRGGSVFLASGYRYARSAGFSGHDFSQVGIGGLYIGIGGDIQVGARVSATVGFGGAQAKSLLPIDPFGSNIQRDFKLNYYCLPVMLRVYAFNPNAPTVFIEAGPSVNWINSIGNLGFGGGNSRKKLGGTANIGARLPIDVSDHMFALQAMIGYAYLRPFYFLNVSGFHILFGIGYLWGPGEQRKTKT